MKDLLKGSFLQNSMFCSIAIAVYNVLGKTFQSIGGLQQASHRSRSCVLILQLTGAFASFFSINFQSLRGCFYGKIPSRVPGLARLDEIQLSHLFPQKARQGPLQACKIYFQHAYLDLAYPGWPGFPYKREVSFLKKQVRQLDLAQASQPGYPGWNFTI